MLSHEINAKFRSRLAGGGAVLMPGAANALAAKIIADLGFEAVYLSGAGLTNTYLGMPDLGFVGLAELVQHTSTIRDATDLPIVVDADTGFGNALNVRHTIRSLERAGASAIQIEDQVSPKRCGHFSGKDVVALDEARSRIKAAADARQDPNLLIVARTDARTVAGIDAAIERAQAFIEDGADITFVEAPENLEEIRAIPARLSGTPQLINLVVGGKTPIVDLGELDAMGFSLVLYANVALQGAICGMQAALGQLKADGRMGEDGPVASFRERQRLVGKPEFDALEKRYAL
ncbi:isocitrate lyase/PEP mutase family protein [Pelagibacterium lacus]|uniref:Carboxyvinyl-carboxyphosphonate phosphorylmutase n=1 Tax=Pelagibacterium lacus TaxID=2282655 RepID=A0A369WA11_9HYPH|nr:isocitrate lyase/phosphoenolpyruvate mutase family protein [Pelagibacterium lacus]RDE10112.1 carboxyvinyl-carboxyphosphonate phosphorylmutase [Pelagibacterium lacus]